MKTIPLTHGKVASVDDQDYETLAKYSWFVRSNCHRSFYAVRSKHSKEEGPHQVIMHRQVLGLHFSDKRQADHRDGDGLNNQRSNLRICSAQQNMFNQRTQKRPKYSRFKGVSWMKARGRWQAGIQINRKRKHLGLFLSERDAALAYNEAAKEYFGEFAKLNSLQA